VNAGQLHQTNQIVEAEWVNFHPECLLELKLKNRKGFNCSACVTQALHWRCNGDTMEQTTME
jgi:hypothetical protein